MNAIVWNLYHNHRRSSALGTAAAFGACFLLAIYWGVSGLLMSSQTQGLRAALKAKESDLAVKQNDLGRPPQTTTTGSVTGYQAVDKLHSALVTECEKAGCVVTQFNSATAPAAYVSQYGVSGSTFVAFHVRIMLTGNLSAILSAMHELADCGVSFEYTSMSVSPTVSNGSKARNFASVSLDLEALARPAPGPPPGAPT